MPNHTPALIAVASLLACVSMPTDGLRLYFDAASRAAKFDATF